jgi:ATP dependent DNA ligase domain
MTYGERLFDPCIPSRALKPPWGPDWVLEIKHDGYRLIVRREGEAVRLFTRRGYDWRERYPAIANAAAKLKARSFTLDGEAVVCCADGVAVFDALHRRGRISDAILQAFPAPRVPVTVAVRLGGLDQGLDLPGRQVLPGSKLGVRSAQLFDLLRLARPA